MTDKKYSIQVMKGKGYSWFKCDCGADEFNVTKSYIEPGIGEIERFFTCDCGKSYHWAYGYITENETEDNIW